VFSAILWEAADGKRRHTLRGDSSAAFSGDGKLLVTGSELDNNNTAILWDTDGGKRLQTFRTNGTTSVAITSDGKYVLTGSGDHAAILWKADSGKKLQTFEGHLNVSSVALSDDAKHALTGSYDNTAILWDATDGKKLHTFQGHTNFVMNVALSRGGKQPWTVSLDGTVRLWDPATGKERCRIYSFGAGKDWLAVTPDGLFDGSAGAVRFVVYRVPGTQQLIGDDATRSRYHRPGLLSQVWRMEN
jgi:WD40 repeat protein